MPVGKVVVVAVSRQETNRDLGTIRLEVGREVVVDVASPEENKALSEAFDQGPVEYPFAGYGNEWEPLIAKPLSEQWFHLILNRLRERDYAFRPVKAEPSREPPQSG